MKILIYDLNTSFGCNILMTLWRWTSDGEIGLWLMRSMVICTFVLAEGKRKENRECPDWYYGKITVSFIIAFQPFVFERSVLTFRWGSLVSLGVSKAHDLSSTAKLLQRLPRPWVSVHRHAEQSMLLSQAAVRWRLRTMHHSSAAKSQLP